MHKIQRIFNNQWRSQDSKIWDHYESGKRKCPARFRSTARERCKLLSAVVLIFVLIFVMGLVDNRRRSHVGLKRRNNFIGL